MRTTGAPKSVMLGADGAAGGVPVAVGHTVTSAAAVELPSAIPAFLEACAKLASAAAARGDLHKVRELAETVTRVFTAIGR